MSEFYEDPSILSEYLSFHYGSPELLMPWDFGPKSSVGFPERVASEFQHHYPPVSTSGQSLRALDIGCAVGRTALELTRWFDHVIGIDYSHAFIHAARKISTRGSINCELRLQGKQFKEIQLNLPEGLNPDRARFEQGDAMELKSKDLGCFDLIVASNLICRLPDPATFLGTIPSMLNPEGVFLLSTPYTYLEDFTEQECWIGGQSGGVPAEKALFDLLSKNFNLLQQTDIPMLIREHHRKYQWTVCQLSAWKHKN